MSTDTPAAAPTAEREAFERWAVKTHGRFALVDEYAGAAWQAWLARAALSAPVAAQPAASGVDAQWVEQLANKARRAWAINPPSIGVLTQEMREIDEALRTHLSTALTGAAKEETNG